LRFPGAAISNQNPEDIPVIPAKKPWTTPVIRIAEFNSATGEEIDESLRTEIKPAPAKVQDTVIILTKPRFLAAMIFAIIADALQIVFLPLFLDGAKSPVEIIFVCGVGVVLVYLLDWQWEFLPSFLAKLLPGIDLVPFWTMAVGGVYWRSKRIPVTANEGSEEPRLCPIRIASSRDTSPSLAIRARIRNALRPHTRFSAPSIRGESPRR
jgi:hypothetical protein